MFISYIHAENQTEMYLHDHTNVHFIYITLWKDQFSLAKKVMLHFFPAIATPSSMSSTPWHLALNIYQSLFYNTTSRCSPLISCKTHTAILKLLMMKN